MSSEYNQEISDGGPAILNLPFKDMYVRIDEDCTIDEDSRFNPQPGPDVDPYHCHIVPEEYKPDIHRLRKVLQNSQKNDFAIFWGGVRMRVCRFYTTSRESTERHERWCVLRRFPSRLPDLEKLKIKESDIEVIRRQGRRQGLIVICGGTGAGKTTTGIATFRHYLKTIGGVGYMVEDPSEYIMQGSFDDAPDIAFVLQREVSEEHEWVQAIKDGLRSNPKFVYLGEVRSPSSASQMLRMANSGHLVMCTVHGSSVEQGISALIQIARADQGELANQLLADSISLIIYQRMTPKGPVLTLMEAQDMSDPVREHIRKNDLKMLGAAIEQQDAVAQARIKANKSQPSLTKAQPLTPVNNKKKNKGWFG